MKKQKISHLYNPQPNYTQRPAYLEEDEIKIIETHIESYLGKIDTVFIENPSDIVNLSIYCLNPTSGRPFHTLITAGMSALPMEIPSEMEGEASSYLELVINLPAEWKLDEESLKDERNYWPINLLQNTALFPHKYATWLGFGHSIPNGNPVEPFASNTVMNASVILPSVVLPPDFHQLILNSTKEVQFFSIIPLYPEEYKTYINRGLENLLNIFSLNDVTDILNIDRPNVLEGL